MPIRVAQYDGSHAHPGNECRERRERAPRFEDRAFAVSGVRHEVIRNTRDVPPGGFEMTPEIQNRWPGLPGEACEDSETHKKGSQKPGARSQNEASQFWLLASGFLPRIKFYALAWKGSSALPP